MYLFYVDGIPVNMRVGRGPRGYTKRVIQAVCKHKQITAYGAIGMTCATGQDYIWIVRRLENMATFNRHLFTFVDSPTPKVRYFLECTLEEESKIPADWLAWIGTGTAGIYRSQIASFVDEKHVDNGAIGTFLDVDGAEIELERPASYMKYVVRYDQTRKILSKVFTR